MYFPLSWPKQLIVQNDDSSLVSVAASYDHFLFAVLTQNTVGIWFCKVNFTFFDASSRRSEIDYGNCLNFVCAECVIICYHSMMSDVIVYDIVNSIQLMVFNSFYKFF